MAISPYVRRLRAADRLCRCGHEWVERSSDSVRGRPPRGSRAISGRPCCRRRTSPLGRGWLTESHRALRVPGAKALPTLRLPCPTTASSLTAAFNHTEKLLVPSRPTAKSRDGLV